MTDIKQHSLYRKMEADGVISAVFNIYFKKFWTLFIYSFIAVFIIQMSLYYSGFWDIYTNTKDPYEMMRMFSGFMGRLTILSVASIIVYGFLNAFLVNYLIKSDIDPKANIGDLLTDSIKKYAIHMIFFIILASVIFVAGIFIGIFAIIVGMFVAMLYLGTVLVIGSTIVVAEEKNAIDTIGRCFNLAHKDFWSALGALVLFVLILIVISLILTAFTAIPFIILFFDNLKETGSFWDAFNLQVYDLGMWLVLINSVVSALTIPLYAIFSVVLYFKIKFTEDQKEVNTIS